MKSDRKAPEDDPVGHLRPSPPPLALGQRRTLTADPGRRAPFGRRFADRDEVFTLVFMLARFSLQDSILIQPPSLRARDIKRCVRRIAWVVFIILTHALCPGG